MNSTYIIAEAGVNHNGSVQIAKELIDVAVEAGADAVKFQSFNASELTTLQAPMAEYQLENTGSKGSQYDMLKKLELSKKDHVELYGFCKNKGIQFLSTPFDEASLNMLTEHFNLPVIKISSGDLTNAPFLLSIAGTQKPVILSTGMSTLDEVETAISILAYGYTFQDSKAGKDLNKQVFFDAYQSSSGREILKEKVTLLHCTSEYPAPFRSVNLNAMDTLKSCFGLKVGYSDHTLGIEVAIAAVARGAGVIKNILR